MSIVPSFKTVRKLSNRIENYKEKCVQEGLVPTISGLALYCGVCKKTLYNYFDKKEFKDILELFRTYCEDIFLNKSLHGIYDASMSKFYMKNELGYKDKLDVDENQTITIQSNIPMKEVK